LSQGYIKFRAAMKSGNVGDAFEAAKALPGLLSLVDALDLTLLAAEAKAEGLFQSCAARWLARVAVEKRLTLDRLVYAAEALQAAGNGDAGNVYSDLSGLLE
jgi:hypothetical protein